MNGAPRGRIHSLRNRVFAASVSASIAAVAVALAIGVVTTRQAIRDSLRQEVEREASVMASRLVTLADGGVDPKQLVTSGELPPAIRSMLETLGGGEPGAPRGDGRRPGPTGPTGPTSGSRMRLPGAGGRGRGMLPMVLPLRLADTVLPADAAARVAARKTTSGLASIAGSRVLFAAVPVGDKDVFVLATRSNSVGASDYGHYFTGLALAALIAAALSAAAAAALARRLTKPIQDVADAAGALAAGRAPERLKPPRTVELAELADSFNEMADNLAHAREAERTVLMSASHELRTPLTAISGYAEGMEDGTIDTKVAAAVIRGEAARLENLVQDLLVLARLDQGAFETRRETVDLTKAAAVARDRLAIRARSAGVSLELSAAAAALAEADAGRVEQVITNLVDNAVRVTPRGGRVLIETRPGEVRVSDTGPGIPAQDMPHVFERFHLRRRRGMGSPDGSGIGLAIVHELTRAMGGDVAVDSREGVGTRFTVRLPDAPARG